MPKQLDFEIEARKKLKAGVDALHDAVAVTLGPRGRTVVLDKGFGNPVVTKDGVAVAKEVEVQDPTEEMAVKMVREVAQNTSDEAGDGTTTATVLAHAIFSEGLKSVTAGSHPMAVRRGIDAGTERVVARLREMSTETGSREAITHVATLSANGDAEIGRMIAEAMETAGEDGVVTVEDGRGLEMELETVDGTRFDQGYLSPYFVTDEDTLRTEFDDTLVLITDEKISTVDDLLPVLETAKEEGRPLLIVADDVEDEALATLVVNRVRGGLDVCAVKAPGFGSRKEQALRDLATLTGAEAISETLGRRLRDVGLSDLGRARRIVVDDDTTTIVDGGGDRDAIQGRADEIRAEIEQASSDYDREKLEERLARLVGGVAVLRVGGATETEMKEKKSRTEDALAATRAAVEEGVLTGGGVALLRAREVLEDLELDDPDEEIGVRILHRALARPTRRIADNAGHEGSMVVERIRRKDDPSWGFDAETESYADMIEAGILDPTKVVRTALQNAASIGGILLTTDTAVAEIPEEEPPAPGGGGPGGAPGAGGMPGGGMPGGMGGAMPGM